MDRDSVIGAFVSDLNYAVEQGRPLELPAKRARLLALALRDYCFEPNRVITADFVRRVIRDAVSSALCDLESEIVDESIERIFGDTEEVRK